MSHAAHTGFVGTSGVQAHSAGPIFPFHIVVQGNGVGLRGCLWAQKGSQVLESHEFHDRDSFKTAHAAAEAEALRVLECEQHARDWESIAADNEKRGSTVHFVNACKRAAESFRLEAKTGVAHCTCHLVPFTECQGGRYV